MLEGGEAEQILLCGTPGPGSGALGAAVQVSKMTTTALLPCFLVANLSTTTMEQLQAGWILPVMATVQILLGALMGQVTALRISSSFFARRTARSTVRQFLARDQAGRKRAEDSVW